MFKGANFLLNVVDNLESVVGRKKFQKIIYLLELKSSFIPYRYSYYYYGPYSSQLQEEINFLVRENFLEESKQNGTYVYKITELGKEFKKAIRYDSSESIKNELLHELNSKSSQFLELVSTYAFLLEGDYNISGAKEKTLELKPHLGTEIDEAIEFYNSVVAVNE